jgi:hypothetical protein
MNWVEIADHNVRMIWRCEDKECDCTKYDCIVDPTFYRDNGTPVCEVGQDMDYIRTEVDEENQFNIQASMGEW